MMLPPLSSPRKRAACQQARPSCARHGGFVLVTVLLLIALVTILVVAGSMLAQVERRVTSTLSKTELARQNALLGLDMAVGQIQASAGPDQRITARADILASNTNNPYWTGVWVTGTNGLDVAAAGTTNQRAQSLGAGNATDAQKAAKATWLVSGTSGTNDPLTFAGGTNSVVLAKNLGTNSANVTVPLVTMQATSTSGGAYAYWVSDEGVKARVNIYDPTIGAATPTGSSAPAFATSQLHFALPQATRVDGPAGNPGILGSGSLAEVRNRPELDRVTSLQSMQFIGDINASAISGNMSAKYSPDATVWSQGVLADARRGGLKKDLSAAFEDFAQYKTFLASVHQAGDVVGDERVFYSSPVPTYMGLGIANANFVIGTRWQSLLNYYSLYKANVPFSAYDPNGASTVASPFAGLSANGTTTAPKMEARPYFYTSSSSNGTALSVSGENLFPRFAAFGIELAMSSEAVPSQDTPGLTYYRLRLHAKPMLVLYNPYNVRVTYPIYSGDNAFLTGLSNGILNNINWSVSAGNATVFSSKPLSFSGVYTQNLSFGLAPKVSDAPSAPPFIPSFNPGELKVFGLSTENNLVVSPPTPLPLSQQTTPPTWTISGYCLGGTVFQFYTGTGITPVHAALREGYGQYQSALLPDGTPQKVPISLPVDHYIDYTKTGQPWQSGNGTGGIATDGMFSSGNCTLVSASDVVTLTLETKPNSSIVESSGDISFSDNISATSPSQAGRCWPVSPSGVLDTYKLLGKFYTAAGAVVPSANNTTVNLGRIDNMVGTTARKPFGLLILRLKGLSQTSASQMPVFASTDAMINALPAAFDTSDVDVEFKFLQNPDEITNELQVTSSGIVDSYWGGSDVGKASSQPDHSSAIILRDVPRQPLVSLGQFMHMAISSQYRTGTGTEYSLQGAPLHSVGGSLASPLLALDKTCYPSTAPVELSPPVDYNFLSNEALFDQYFFSTVPPANPDATYSALFPSLVGGAGFNDAYVQAEGRLPNNRMKYYRRGGVAPASAPLQKVDTAAANLLLNGAFNINSTSVPAWRALLSSLSGNDLSYLSMTSSGNGTFVKKTAADLKNPILRFLSVVSADGIDPVNSKWGGVRSLTDAQVNDLATEIVKQVKLRGPFLSMADFLNRRLDATTGLGYKGALQAAIDATTINTGLGWGQLTTGTPPLKAPPSKPAPAFNTATMAAVAPNTAVGIPGWLMQQDIVQCFSPVMAVRSDTFAIRVYGESRNTKTGAIEGKAWGEAIVQRTPDLVDAAQVAETAQSAMDPTNKQYGRRFQVVSFRWLNENDI